MRLALDPSILTFDWYTHPPPPRPPRGVADMAETDPPADPHPPTTPRTWPKQLILVCTLSGPFKSGVQLLAELLH